MKKSSIVNPLSANPIKWSNTLKQFVGNLPANCLSVFDHFVGLALKGLTVTRFSNLDVRRILQHFRLINSAQLLHLRNMIHRPLNYCPRLQENMILRETFFQG